jgi:hypothetical protein
MSNVRNILVVLICASPLLLLWDGLIVQGLVAATVAGALGIAAGTLRPGEANFLISLSRPYLVAAAIPALWILLQIFPLGVLAHPIWKSAEAGLQHPLAGKITLDPGVSIVALGHYLSLAAIAFLSAAVAVDRQRAETILFAMSAAVAVIGLIVVAQSLSLPSGWFSPLAHVQAIDCAGLGTMIAAAACLRVLEHLQVHRGGSKPAHPMKSRTLAACGVALAICCMAVAIGSGPEVMIATGYGLLALASVMIVRRFRLGLLGLAGMAVLAIGIAVALVATHPAPRGTTLPIAYAEGSSHSLVALSQRVLDDAPAVGTGAGTFAALAPTYREMDDPPPGAAASTAAGALAIELGKPMLWLISAAAVAAIIALLGAALQRGRDAFYPAMAGGCLTTLLALLFINAGPLGTATGLIAAAALGVGLAQSKSRRLQT